MPNAVATSNYEKYQTKNPIMRGIIARFLDQLVAEIESVRPRRVVDLGCGEGLVAERAATVPGVEEYRGFEINAASVDHARTRVPSARFDQANILELEPDPAWADLALCIEVLEHLDTPEVAVKRIHTWTSRWAIVSVPWEPWFRTGNLLRGKYLAHWGNHPEHVQQFSPRSLEALMRREFPKVRVVTCFPWLIAICEKT